MLMVVCILGLCAVVYRCTGAQGSPVGLSDPKLAQCAIVNVVVSEATPEGFVLHGNRSAVGNGARVQVYRQHHGIPCLLQNLAVLGTCACCCGNISPRQEQACKNSSAG